MKNGTCEFCRHGFLAVLSHELRNPLAALSNSLYVLMNSQPGEARADRAVAVMQRQIRHMAALVDTLAETAALGRTSMVLHLAWLNLVELLHHTCLDHEHLFVKHELELREELPEALPPVQADPTRLMQVIGILLANAAQFTPPGGHIVVRLEHDMAGQRARMRVQDSGVGLAAELRECLFEPFTRSEPMPARGAGGLGLELALVKGIIELHDGSVWAESAGPGLGTAFIVELPCSAAIESG